MRERRVRVTRARSASERGGAPRSPARRRQEATEAEASQSHQWDKEVFSLMDLRVAGRQLASTWSAYKSKSESLYRKMILEAP
eukprot:2448543-Prymnesium_polylepis.1